MANQVYTADQVSKFLVFTASNKVIGDAGEAEGITNLKLQKILYFVEAYFPWGFGFLFSETSPLTFP